MEKKSQELQLLNKQEIWQFAWRSYKYSLELAKNNTYDLAHAYYSFSSGLTALLLHRKIRLPYVISLQELDLVKISSLFLNFIMRKVWKSALFLIADSKRLQTLILGSNPKKEISLITKGVDLDFGFPDYNKRNKQQFTLLVDSEVIPIKGIRFLLQAVKLLSGRYDQIRLHIVGDGEEKQSLQDLARGLEIDTKITFLGKVSLEQQLYEYQGADVFILPSLDAVADNGIALRKALTVGLPIITTPVSGTEELLVDGKNGYMVKIKTADDLAEKIEKILLDKNLQGTMEKNSLEIAQKMSWKNIANKYLDVYIEAKNISQIQN